MGCHITMHMILIGEEDIQSFISVIWVSASVFPGLSDTAIG